MASSPLAAARWRISSGTIDRIGPQWKVHSRWQEHPGRAARARRSGTRIDRILRISSLPSRIASCRAGAARTRRVGLPYRSKATGNTMNTETAKAGADKRTDHRTGDPAARPMGIRQAFREIRKGIVVMWWGFFDWVAVVSWKALLLVSLLAMILGGGVLKLPTLTFFLIVASFIIKVVAGGKRRAELDRQPGQPARGHRAARAQPARSADGSAAGADRAALPLQYAGQHRPAHPDRPAARLQDAAEPDPLPALGDAADARRQAARRSVSRSVFAARSWKSCRCEWKGGCSRS